MSSEPKLISVIGEKPLPKYYVYFDEWSGEITNITNKAKRSDDPYIITEDKTAADLMMGLLNPKKFLVSDITGEYVLVPKSDHINLRKAEEILSKVPDVPLTVDSDINIIVYINSWIMEVNINQDTMFRLTGRRFNRKFKKEDNVSGSELDLYIIKHNNPHYLIDTIKIDPIELMNNGYIIFDMSHLKNVCGLGEIDVLTKRVFKSYGLKTKQNYVNVDYHTRKSHRRINTIITNTDKWTTFTISPSTEGWIIKSNFDDPNEQKIYRDLNIYLVGDDPNYLHDRIKIPYSHIGWQQEYIAETKVDPRWCRLMMGEEGKNVTFNFEEIKYVKSGKY